MIYKGSQKEGKVYKGGTTIGKIYKGSQLVYQSQKSLKLYGYSDDNSTSYLIGGMTTSNPYLARTDIATSSSSSSVQIISSITGTLGVSGSSIKSTSNDSVYNYQGTFTINGIKIHRYRYDGYLYFLMWIMEGSTVGSTALRALWININHGYGFPTSVGSNNFTYYFQGSITTGARLSSADKTWTINGVY